MRNMPLVVDDSSSGVSAFFLTCIDRMAFKSTGRALDVPCGFGRHSSWLARRGFDVSALDIDPERVQATKGSLSGAGSIEAQVGDATLGLPFEQSVFDIALVIHYVAPNILSDVADVLKPGGHLIFETFGGQGQNWIDLPLPGAVRETLEPRFNLLIYKERAVGRNRETVSVKLLGQKRFPIRPVVGSGR